MANDLKRYFRELRVKFKEVLALKNDSSNQKAEIAEKRKYASLLFVLIKKVNRMEKYKVRQGRDKLHSEKLRVDSNRLQLQNLLYEVNHLKREIRHCHRFKSQDEDIDLLKEEEYLQILDDKGKKRPPNSGHAKRLVRLEYELALRKQLAANCKDLHNSKKQVFQDIVLKMERLTSFAPSLRTLLKATQPLQEALQIPVDREWKLRQLVQLLPQPLYLAYMNIHVLEDVLDALSSITVIGTEDDVQRMDMEAEFELINNCSETGESGDADEPSTSEMTSERLQKMRKSILEPHPLVVRFEVAADKNSSECVTIDLRFFPKLGLVAASAAMVLKEMDYSLGEISSSQNFLKHLFDNDDGNIIPVSKAEFELEKVDMTPEECLEHLDKFNFGKPYRWLQNMCCIEMYDQPSITEHKLLKTISDIIKRIQILWISRLSLINQIRGLVTKNIDLYMRDGKLPLVKPSCSLVQWTSITKEEYFTNDLTMPYRSADLVSANNFFFRAVVVRGSAKMECLISVSSKFPLVSPLWVISVYWNGQHNALNNAAVKMMELCTNQLDADQLENKLALLSSQLIRTMYSFDILLETESPNYNPVEYYKEKLFIKAFSKRLRARPFRYVEGAAANTFKQ